MFHSLSFSLSLPLSVSLGVSLYLTVSHAGIGPEALLAMLVQMVERVRVLEVLLAEDVVRHPRLVCVVCVGEHRPHTATSAASAMEHGRVPLSTRLTLNKANKKM